MPSLAMRSLSAGLDLATMGLDSTGLGKMDIAIETAATVATVQAAVAQGIRYVDTAPFYEFGLAESCLGEVLRMLPRNEIVISSKVGYDLVPVSRDAVPPTMWADTPLVRADVRFTRDAVRRAIEGSMTRLGVDRVDMLAIHDPDEASIVGDSQNPHARSRFAEAIEGACPVRADLRRQGSSGRSGPASTSGRCSWISGRPTASIIPAREPRHAA